MPFPFSQSNLSKSSREQPAAGLYTAVIDGLVDLGSQATPNGQKRQLLMLYRLLETQAGDGRPFVVNRWYNYTSHPGGTLTADIQAILGRRLTPTDKFDLSEMVGRVCGVQVALVDRNGKTYANISQVRSRPAGSPERVACADAIVFSLSDPFNPGAFASLPAWVQRKVQESPEYLEATGSPNSSSRTTLDRAQRPTPRVDDLANDEIPF